MGRTSILIVTNSNDARESTEALRLIADALASKEDVDATVLLLRRYYPRPNPKVTAAAPRRIPPWPGARIVDDLRTWIPAAAAERLGSPQIANRLRGARLRWWIRRADPTAVLLDDGLGYRVVEHLPRRPVCITRINPELPVDPLESDTLPDPDLVIAAADIDAAAVDEAAKGRRAAVLWEGSFDDVKDAPERAADADRRATRSRLGLPEDAIVVSGWGGDGWLDGPDIFVRALWALRERHGIEAHGVWFGTEQPEELQRLADEAERCGLSEHYHSRPYAGVGAAPADATCADAVLLPSRAALVREHVVPAILCGLVVVTFDVADIDDPAVRCAPDLDVDALSSLLAEALDDARAERSRRALDAVSVDRWSSRLVAMIREQRT